MATNKMYYLILAIILTAITSVSCHALILHYFSAPRLVIPQSINNVVGYAIKLSFITASVIIFRCSKIFWRSLNIFYQIILFSILILALTGQFRWIMMQIIVGYPWQYQILSSIPFFLSSGVMALVICMFFHKISMPLKYRWLIYILFVVVSTALFIITTKFFSFLIHPIIIHVPQAKNIIFPPYNLNVLIPAYISSVEPATASFIVFYIIKDYFFRWTTLMKGLTMASLIILIHGGLFSLVEIIYSQGNVLYRLFYYGQILWEYIALGLLTAYFVSLLCEFSSLSYGNSHPK